MRIKRILSMCLVAALLAGAMPAFAQRSDGASTPLLTDATGTGSSGVQYPSTINLSFHAYGLTTAGAGAATIIIEVSDRATPATDTTVDWITACTISLTLATTQVSDGCTMSAPWHAVRARVSAISGTGAKVSVRMGS